MDNSNQDNKEKQNEKVGKGVVDAASKSVNPYVKGAGMAAKGIDKVTGGKASKLVGGAINKANEYNPLKTKLDRLRNNRNNNRMNSINGKNEIPNRNNPNMLRKNNGGGANSLPSSGGTNPSSASGNGGTSSTSENKSTTSATNNSSNGGSGGSKGFLGGLSGGLGGGKRKGMLSSVFGGSSEEESSSEASGEGKFDLKIKIPLPVIAAGAGLLLLILPILFAAQSIGLLGEFDAGLGVSYASGGDTGSIQYSSNDPDKNAFFSRVAAVKNTFASSGKNFNPVLIAGVFTLLNSNGAKITYNDFGLYEITQIANAMFEGNVYNEETFKKNLAKSIIPKYIFSISDEAANKIAEDIIDYVDRYNDFIGLLEESDVCSSGAGSSCTYDIKGYYIAGKGNVKESLKLDNLYVKLMQCGFSDGHNYGGTYGKPLEGEALVPFEKYILGVAYQEIGPDAHPEAFKAQMVAARSYILARHADMGGWRTITKEGDKWILTAASCTADQVYCDPDKGCSSSDGQWSQVHSGLNAGTSVLKQPIPSDSNLRSLNKQTSGEVLVNHIGHIVYSGYVDTEQEQFENLANSGLDYKQILLQVYNSGSRDYGATNISKATCTNTSAGCGEVSSGEFVNWKQHSPAWANVPLGSRGETIQSVGCLVTSVAMLIAKSGVPTVIDNFNPGTFVQFLNTHGGFNGSYFRNEAATYAAPSFKSVAQINVLSWSREEKLNKLKELLSDGKTYVVAEVKGNTGGHWVAIDTIQGDNIVMMDPGRDATDLWGTYNWQNTSHFAIYRVE